MMNELLWYGASVQIENISSCGCSIEWAYVELKARSQSQAEDKLKRMFREGVKINYCQLI